MQPVWTPIITRVKMRPELLMCFELWNLNTQSCRNLSVFGISWLLNYQSRLCSIKNYSNTVSPPLGVWSVSQSSLLSGEEERQLHQIAKEEENVSGFREKISLLKNEFQTRHVWSCLLIIRKKCPHTPNKNKPKQRSSILGMQVKRLAVLLSSVSSRPVGTCRHTEQAALFLWPTNPEEALQSVSSRDHDQWGGSENKRLRVTTAGQHISHITWRRSGGKIRNMKRRMGVWRCCGLGFISWLLIHVLRILGRRRVCF